MDIAAGDRAIASRWSATSRACRRAWLRPARVVLLGSIATDKYVDVLVPRWATRLHYPAVFIGRGDMSRGGLLLRSAASGVELRVRVLDPGAARHGPRPPKLPPQMRR